MAHRFQKVYGISRKTLNGLREDDVYFSIFGILQHTLELISFLYSCAGYSIVSVDPRILPIWVSLYQRTVIADLRRQRVVHTLRFH